MRALIILVLLAAVRAEVGGYNYAAGVSGGGATLAELLSNGVLTDGGSLSGGSAAEGSYSGGTSSASFSGGAYSGGSLSGGSYSGGSSSGGSLSSGSLSGGSYSGGSLSSGSLSGGSYSGGSSSGGSLSSGSLSGGSYSGGSLSSGSLSGGSYPGGSSSGSSLSSGSLSGGSYSGGSLSSGSLSGGSHSGGSQSGGSLSSSSFTGGSGSSNYAPANTEFNKEFFTYSAPEIDFEDGKTANELAANLKKNLRVVFIRTPENKGLENAALALAKQAAEQQTAIYVLTKQGDLSSLANKLQNLNHVSANKPEVHFVKYRTPEDALNAQRTIQHEYERLGGSSQSHHGGVAPVLDFATKQHTAPARNLAGSSGSFGGTSGAVNAIELESPNAYVPPAPAAPSSSYLPVNKVK